MRERPFYRTSAERECSDSRDGRRCPRAPAQGYNPLSRCDEHLAAYRALIEAHGFSATPAEDDGPTMPWEAMVNP